MLDEGRRAPEFIRGASTDGLVKAVMRLAMEVSVLRERMDVYEAVSSQQGISEETIESFVPDEALQKKRAERRKRLIRLLVKDLG